MVIFFAGGGNSCGMSWSSDNGNSWHGAGLTNIMNITTLAVKGNTIFAGTEKCGIWRRLISEMVGIKENIINNNISIYPNPTKDNLTIETNANQEQRLEILNLFGQTVYTNSINKKAVVNTSAFANGVYILKIYSDKETIVRKFIKE